MPSPLLGCQAVPGPRQPRHDGVNGPVGPIGERQRRGVVQAVGLQLVGDPGQLGDQRVHPTGCSGAALPVGPLSAGGAAVGRIAAGVAEQLTAGRAASLGHGNKCDAICDGSQLVVPHPRVPVASDLALL